MNIKKRRAISGAALIATVALLAGSGVSALASSSRAENPDPEKGIVIIAVSTESPAAKAGLVRGDILQEVDGEAVDTIVDLCDVLDNMEPDSVVDLTVLHGDEIRTLSATLGDRDGRAFLGVTPGSARLEHMDFTVIADEGVVIAQVLPDSPAEKARLMAGDLILAIDGEEISSGSDLADAVASSAAGEAIVLEVETSDGDQGIVELEVELAQHPEDKSMAYLGIRFSRVPQGMLSEEFPLRHLEGLMPRSLDQERFEPPFIGPGELFEGALVMRVAPASPAAEAGLQPGDVIISINNKPVSDMDSVTEAIAEFQPGDLVMVTVHSSHQQDGVDPETIEITLSERPDGYGKAYLGVTIGGVRFGTYEGDPGSRKRTPFWQQFDFDEYPERRGGSNDRRFRWLPDWDLDMDFEMPFHLDSLRERFREPRLFQFDWTPSQEAGAESSGSASASA